MVIRVARAGFPSFVVARRVAFVFSVGDGGRALIHRYGLIWCSDLATTTLGARPTVARVGLSATRQARATRARRGPGRTFAAVGPAPEPRTVPPAAVRADAGEVRDPGPTDDPYGRGPLTIQDATIGPVELLAARVGS